MLERLAEEGFLQGVRFGRGKMKRGHRALAKPFTRLRRLQ
jgi:hypothetical protein